MRGLPWAGVSSRGGIGRGDGRHPARPWVDPARLARDASGALPAGKMGTDHDHLAGAPAARRLAGGAGVVFLAALVDRGLRFGLTWLLSTALGAAAFGIYVSAVTVLGLVTAVSPLGMDGAAVYFGARQRQAGDHGAWKGTVLATLGVGTLAGLAMALAVVGLASGGPLPGRAPALAAALVHLSPAVPAWALLLACVGLLRARHDMRASALSFQILLPLALLAGAAFGLWRGGGLPSVLDAWVFASVIAAVVAFVQVLRREAALLRDPMTPARAELRRLLGHALPQSIEKPLFLLTHWTDLLVLTWLATAAEVGVYKIASSLALLCMVPVGAVGTAVSPLIAERFEGGDRDDLVSLLRVASRTLVLLLTPVVAGVVLVPELPLALFADEYAAGVDVLRVLALGQLPFAAAIPCIRAVPMSGRAWTNLADQVAVVVLNLVLNAVLVPEHGALGAAVATACTLAAWALLATVQVRWMLGRALLDPTSRAVLIVAALVSLGAVGLVGAPLPVRLAAAASAVIGPWGWLLLRLRGPDRGLVQRLRRRGGRPGGQRVPGRRPPRSPVP